MAKRKKKPNPAAVALGALGGKARAKNLSARRLSNIGRKGGEARSRNLNKKQLRRIAMLGVAARKRKLRDAKKYPASDDG